MDIGSIVRKERKRRGWSLQTLADKCGISKGYVWEIEHNSGTRGPSFTKVCQIADALSLSITVFQSRGDSYQIGYDKALDDMHKRLIDLGNCQPSLPPPGPKDPPVPPGHYPVA